MSQIVPTPHGNDWKPWGRQLAQYLARYASRLQFKEPTSNVQENGVILWDEATGGPVISKDGQWYPLTLGSPL